MNIRELIRYIAAGTATIFVYVPIRVARYRMTMETVTCHARAMDQFSAQQVRSSMVRPVPP